MRALGVRKVMANYWTLPKTNCEQLSKLLLLPEKLPKNSTENGNVHLAFETNKKVRKTQKNWISIYGMTECLQNIVLDSCPSFLSMEQMLSIRLWHAINSWLFMTTGEEPLSIWMLKIYNAKLVPMCGVGWVGTSWSLLLIWSVTVFWVLLKAPGKDAQQVNMMELQHQHLTLESRKSPVLQNNAWPTVIESTLQKVNELG